ncbi:hypothetical protein K439DRAFT_1640928 [Ramaria rubella]|nr:hypothetical protein K439DRAFT_1640928 [Ramaria rubella]
MCFVTARLLTMLAQDEALHSSELHCTLLAPDNSTVGTGELDVSVLTACE